MHALVSRQTGPIYPLDDGPLGEESVHLTESSSQILSKRRTKSEDLEDVSFRSNAASDAPWPLFKSSTTGSFETE